MSDSETLSAIKVLVCAGEVRVSQHGFEELRDDQIPLADVLDGVPSAVVVEDYPDYAKGPCVLCLQQDRNRQPLHVLWGLAAANREVATLITAYRPDPSRWTHDFLSRKTR